MYCICMLWNEYKVDTVHLRCVNVVMREPRGYLLRYASDDMVGAYYA